jgi:hypothetical protein
VPILYGFNDLRHLFSQRVTEAGVEIIGKAIDASVAVHNQAVTALFDTLVERTTEFKTVYKTSSLASLQPLDEFGRARPIVVGGSYELGYPIQSAGIAWARTRKAAVKMTVEEVNDLLVTLFDADVRWLRTQMLTALFRAADWSFADEEHGTLTVKPLANNDTVVYMKRNDTEYGSTDNHLLAQATFAEANPYLSLANTLREHPDNEGQVVTLIAEDLQDETEALTSFMEAPDPNITPGNADATLNSDGPNSIVPGEKLGYDKSSRSWIRTWDILPSGYMISYMTNGVKPLRMREDPDFPGFAAIAEREDHPYWERQYERTAGFGAYNRTGAAVMRIGNANYAAPTGYATPHI